MNGVDWMSLSKGLLLFAVLGGLSMSACCWGEGLARNAVASASESLSGYSPDKAIDGDPATHWSTIPGHGEGNWLQLDWTDAVGIAEVVITFSERYTTSLEVQTWDADKGTWVTQKQMGQPNLVLPKTVVCRFELVSTKKLRIGNITGGCAISELQVSESAFAAYSPEVRMASDLNGNFIGVVTDPWGYSPVVDGEVELTGTSRTGPWTCKAHTDKNGLFGAAMPLGLSGKVSVKARVAGADWERSEPKLLDASEFFYGLTPISIEAKRVSLNGKWRFTMGPPEGFWSEDFDDGKWSEINVPAHWEMEGFKSVEGIGGYRRKFTCPAGSGRLKLRFDGVYSGAEVWVNGTRLAYHEGGATPFEVDITDVVRKGENLLALRVSEETFTSTEIDKMSYYAGFALAGIMRSAYLVRTPDTHIGAISVNTTFDGDYRDAAIKGRIAVVNERDKDFSDLFIRCSLKDSRGKAVSVASDAVPVSVSAWRREDAEFEVRVKSPAKWEAEHPNLYVLTVDLMQGGRAIQSLKQRIGFRDVRVKGTQILVNGVSVKIRGAAHHDQHPLMGRAVTPEFARKDLEQLKECNLNGIRTSHYPPLPEVLDVADELGLYVESEASMCWISNGSDLRNTPRFMQLAAELVMRDRNHPSVFCWSLCNESAEDSYGVHRAFDLVKAVDPTRPAFYSGTKGEGDELCSYHNPTSMARIAHAETRKVPVLWDESFACFQGIYGDVGEMWVDPGMRDYYIEPYKECYEAFIRSRVIQGHFIWAWSDDLFCVPNRGYEYGRVTPFVHFVENEYAIGDRGIVGDAPWGVVDGWRRPKPEFWLHKKLESPVRISESPLPVPAADRTVRIPVWNTYDFTDLSELIVAWELGDDRGLVDASLPAHSAGSIEVKLPRSPSPGEELKLTFTDARGVLVDVFSIPFARKRPCPARYQPVKASPLRVIDENMMSGYGKRIVGADFELAFNQGAWGMGNGFLHRSTLFGKPMLLEFPTLHILPSHNAMRPEPDVLNWTMRTLDVKEDGDSLLVTLTGSYDQYDGSYEMTITPEGGVTMRSRFVYTGEKDLLAREVGLRFSVGKKCNVLRWDRNAEWNVYPDSHIGRPRGTAVAFATHGTEVPPTWDWSQDNSPMGSNDFRGTKRHINWAGISYEDGTGVLIDSDGSQHVRATVETDRISVCVNDWYGGIYAGRWRPIDLTCFSANYTDGKVIKKGDVLESVVKLRLVRFQE